MGFWQQLKQVEKEYIEFLHGRGCIRIGKAESFVLKSGRKSNYFFDAQESFDSEALPVVGRAYSSRITKDLQPGSFDAILGPAEKGTAIALATAMNLPTEYGRVPVFWDRKVAKDYGSQKRPSWIVGPYEQLKQLVRNKNTIKTLVADDVITTGMAKKETMNKQEQEVETLRKELSVDKPVSVEWVGIYISVNRRETDEQGRNPMEVFKSELRTPISWVTDSYNIFGYLQEIGLISKKNVSDFVTYQEQYGLPEDRQRLEELKSLV